MARPCTVCVHEDVFEINEDLVLRGQSNRAVARQFSLSADSVRRHREHIPQLLVKARDRDERAEAEDLVERVEELARETRAILREAREGEGKDNELALRAIARLEKQIELEGKILEIIKTQPQVNVLINNPEWIELRATLLYALEDYPEARGSVLKALQGAGSGSGA